MCGGKRRWMGPTKPLRLTSANADWACCAGSLSMRGRRPAHSRPPTRLRAPTPASAPHAPLARAAAALLDAADLSAQGLLATTDLLLALRTAGRDRSTHLRGAALRLDDVTADGLLVRKTKFHKSRLVPLHETTDAALARYLEQRKAVGGGDDHVFISTTGGALTYAMVNGTFHYLIASINLASGPDQRPPRIHDPRHYFALKALGATTAGVMPLPVASDGVVDLPGPRACRRYLLVLAGDTPPDAPASPMPASTTMTEERYDRYRAAYHRLFAPTPWRRQAASPHTCDTYAYAFQLLFAFASHKLGIPHQPCNSSTSTHHSCWPFSNICKAIVAMLRAPAMPV